MNNNYLKVKNIALSMGYEIKKDLPEKNVLVIQNNSKNLDNIILGINTPILIIEMLVFEIKRNFEIIYKKLLQKNRDMIHGAFALDHTGKKVIYRDTLQLENLDDNEIKGTLHSLELLMEEYEDTIQEFSRY